MNGFLNGVARALAETFDLPGPVLEIGSYQVPGQEGLADLRPLFVDKPYTGLDARPGPGVDLVADVESLPYPDASVGTVIAMSTFEHVPRFWKGFEEIYRILRSDGALVVACPFYFHIHDHPCDYWRFTPSALELLLADYTTKLIGWHGPEARPANVWALGFREERPPISDAEHAHYQQLMRQYAREPLPLRRRLLYQLGRVLCGSRPFAPWLQREAWQSMVLSHPTPRVERPIRRVEAPAVQARVHVLPR